MENLLLVGILIFTFAAVAMFAVIGIGFARQYAELYKKKYVKETGQQLQEMFSGYGPEQMLILSALTMLAGALVGFLLLGGGWLVGISLCLVGAYAPRAWLNIARNKRYQKFEEQLMDALSTISNSMKAGFSLIQALEMCAREMNPPISQEFGLLLREHKVGVNLDVAMQNLSNRIPSKNLELVVSSILIARSTGGNLSEVLTSIAKTMRDIKVIEGKINSLTAQGKLQGLVIGALPLLMGWLMYKLDPTMMEILFEDPIGWGIIGLIIFFEIIGAFFIWRIINIDI